jgi:hypothetical protein
MASSSTTSTTYSTLLRQSKLIAYTPSIDQVYSSHSSHLSRQSFGLKRPLPSSSSKRAPYIRINHLDTERKTTDYRQATKETLFTKKWSMANLPLKPDLDIPVTGVQSRFVPSWSEGGLRVPGAEERERRPVNPFGMREEEFERLLRDLKVRREEFGAFVEVEASRMRGTGTGVATGATGEVLAKGLYTSAQLPPHELRPLITRFLSIPDPTLSAETLATQLPSSFPHPTLALQYAPITPLESSLSPPLPARLLGPIPSSGSNNNGARSRYSENRNGGTLTSVLSLIAKTPNSSTYAAPSTSFFPDASGTRSNAPGQVTVRMSARIENASSWAKNAALSSAKGSGQGRFMRAGRNPRNEPGVLSFRGIKVDPYVVIESSALRGPGTQAYSGDIPRPVGQTDLTAMFPEVGYGNTRQASSNRFTREASRSGEDKRSYKQQKQVLREAREGDDKTYAVRKPKGGKVNLQALLQDLMGKSQ